jgi:TP901 family phage tail tape measure protein
MATRDEIIRLLIETAGEDQIDSLNKALAQLEKDAAGGGTAAEKLAAELDKLATATKAAGDMVALKAAIADTEDRLSSARQKLADLNATYDETERKTKGVAREFTAAEKAVSGLESDLNSQNLALQKMGGALAKAGVDVTALVSEEQRLRTEALKAAEALAHNERVTKENAEAAARNAAALKQMGDAFASARDRVSDIATKLTAAGAAAAAAAVAFAAYKTGEFFKGAIESAADFEAQISEIAAVSGSTGAELEMLGEVARNAALDTGESFAAVNSTLGELARAVGDAEKAAAMLGPTLNLATAGGLEAAKSAEILTTTLTQFGLATEHATRVADLLANGANVTTASVEQLGGALSYAAPLARQLGMDVEETVAAIGALADEGFRGERAGTALRNVMSQLSDPASAFNAELDKLGIQTRNFNEVIAALAAAGGKAQGALLSLDAAARPAITALVNSGGAGIARLNASFEEMAVTAASAAKVMRNNLQGAASQAGRAFEDLKNQLVQPLLEPLTREFQAVGVAMREFAQSPEFAQIQTALKTMFEAGIEGAREFLGTIDWMDLAQQVTSFADTAGAKLKEFSGSVEEYIGYAKEVFNAFGVVVDGLQTGIFGTAAALAKLGQVTAQVTAVYLVLQKLNPAADRAAKAIGVDLADAVKKLEEMGGGLGAVYDEFANRTASNFDELRDGLDRIGEGLENTAGAAGAAGQGIADGMAPAAVAVEDISEALADLPAEAETSAGKFTAALASMLSPDLTKTQVEALKAALRSAFEAGVISSEELSAAIFKMGSEVESAAGFIGKSAATAGKGVADGLAPAEAAAARLENAFTTLRIESQANLETAARNAQGHFDTIVAASRNGAASLADVRAAFEAYARAQLAAAANMDAGARQQVEAMLRIKGGAIGATEALERLGLVGSDAPASIKPPADRSTSSLHGLADAADRASGSVTGLGDSAEQAGERLDGMGYAAQNQGLSLGEMSEEAAKAYLSLNRFITANSGNGGFWSKEVNRLTALINEQRDAYRAEMEQIEATAEANSGLAKYLAAVRREYNYLSEAQQRALAEARKRQAEASPAEAYDAQNRALSTGNDLLVERNALLDRQAQQTQQQAATRVVEVRFTQGVMKVEFDVTRLTQSDKRALAQIVIDEIGKDRP